MSSKIQLAVGLDAGSGRTRCVICVIENGGIRYLAHGLAPAAGWVKAASATRWPSPNRFTPP